MLSAKAEAIIAAARLHVVSMENPRLGDLPFDGYRLGQAEAIEEIVDGFREVDCVVLDAPTGSGKTLIAESVRRMLGARGVYCCHSIGLQEQFVGDYGYAKLLKGRGNYRPVLVRGHGKWDATCADCTKENCALCPSLSVCPYEMAKHDALAAPLAVLNTQYLLTEGNGPGRFKGRDLVIADECDTLESELMRYVSVDISKRRADQYSIREPGKVTVASNWVDWFGDTIPRIVRARAEVRGETVRATRERDYLGRLLARLRWVQPRIGEGWVYTGRDGRISFKPVTVDGIGKGQLWHLGKKWLLMSATVVSAGELLGNLGWDRDYRVVSMASGFPVENRPVFIRPSVRMKKDADPQGLIEPLQQILRNHHRERVLLHCVSYRLAGYLHGKLARSCQEIGMGCSTYQSSDGKSEALSQYRSRTHGAGNDRGHLLIAPSLDRGVDLPDDDCRVIVIAKIPYPYLGDRQVSARLHGKGGQVWYDVQTVRTLVQMCGRGVRHKDDRCVTYILDASFNDLWNKTRHLFPVWWKESLVWR